MRYLYINKISFVNDNYLAEYIEDIFVPMNNKNELIENNNEFLSHFKTNLFDKILDLISLLLFKRSNCILFYFSSLLKEITHIVYNKIDILNLDNYSRLLTSTLKVLSFSQMEIYDGKNSSKRVYCYSKFVGNVNFIN